MKRYILVVLLGLALSFSSRAQYVPIPDAAFVTWLQGHGFSAALSGSQLDTTNNLVITTTSLSCSGVPIRNLTGIQYFKALQTLDCSNDSVSNIPALPATLITFNCSYNLLPALPALPSALTGVLCIHNRIAALPVLPALLNTLKCDSCLLTALPALPARLTTLSCSYCRLTALPALPDSMVLLNFSNNAGITCLPELTKIGTLNFAGTGVTCLPNYGQVTTSTPALNTLTLCGIYSPTGCTAFWNISGTTYFDNNGDCQMDYTDAPLANMKVQLDSANVLVQQVVTNAGGLYSFLTTKNHTYKVTVDTTTNLGLRVTCPGNDYHLDTLALADSLSYNNNFAMQCRGFDVGVQSILSTGLPRPGAHIQLNTVAGDLTALYGGQCAAGHSGQVYLTFTGPVTYLGPAPGALPISLINGNVLTWNIADYGAVNPLTAFNLLFAVDSNATVGANVCINVNITPFLNDANQLNNSFNYCFAIVNSLNPNEKDAYPIDTIGLNGGWLTYTIRFQNTGNAPAINMVIVDTLSANLDASTFQLLACSAQNLTQLFGNRVVFNFPNINLPDSSANRAASTGYVQYRVKLKTGLALRTIINNRASVYFNLNSPVITNTIADTVVTCTPNGSIGSRTICEGEVVVFRGAILDSSGLYTDTVSNVGGCDSLISLYLTVNPVTFDSINKTLCTGDTFYLDSTHAYGRYGTYYDTVLNTLGCDSFITVVIIVDQVSFDTIVEYVCAGDSVHFGNRLYGAAGSYNDTIFNLNGCPISITTLYLLINPLPVVTLSWGSMVANGDFAASLPVPGDTGTCFNLPFYFLSGGQPAGGSYRGIGVSYDTLFYEAFIGKDSIIYAYTDSNGCTAKALDTVFIRNCEGINALSTANLFTLYPNPADDYVMIDFDANYTGATVLVKDITGRELYQTRLTANPQQIPTGNLPTGVYLVTMYNNGQVGTRLLVKE